MNEPLNTPESANQTQRTRPQPVFRCEALWKEVREAYCEGEGSTRFLAAEYNIPLSTLQARCRREGWVEGRECKMWE